MVASCSTDYYRTDRSTAADAYYRTIIDDGRYAGIGGDTCRSGDFIRHTDSFDGLFIRSSLFRLPAYLFFGASVDAAEVRGEREDGKRNDLSDSSTKDFTFQLDEVYCYL